LHFNDNADAAAPGAIGYDKIFKVRPVVDVLNKAWKLAYTPGWAQSVDEMMIAFKGRTHLRQYMKAKIVKWGFKLWGCCDAKSGFCSHFAVYEGKRPGEPPTKDLGASVVKNMTKHLKPGSLVVADNFFSSPMLAKDMKESGLQYLGTLRTNRKYVPADLLKFPGAKSKVPRGESKFAVCSKTGLTVCVWNDNKPVNVIGSCYSPELLHECDRRGKNPQGFNAPVKVEQPEMIYYYNMFMGGVDHMDQLRATYPIEGAFRQNKWYKKLFMGIFGIAVTNA
jgi:hypothetical protein